MNSSNRQRFQPETSFSHEIRFKTKNNANPEDTKAQIDDSLCESRWEYV